VNDATGPPPGEPEGAGDRDPWLGVAGLVLIVVLVLAGYLLLEKLSAVSALQDCVMSGRTNCAPIESVRPRADGGAGLRDEPQNQGNSLDAQPDGDSNPRASRDSRDRKRERTAY
jgi:hypothetical protein